VLIGLVRAGDPEAFDSLYRRHAARALRRAHYLARTWAGAEDLRAEAFTRVLSAIRHGSGPTTAMLPYLGTVMRHIADDWQRGERQVYLAARTADVTASAQQGDPVLAAQERSMAAVAFAALPERWQSVLWHTEVEGQRPGQLVGVLGIEAGAVAALASRAREGLRAAYLQAHITEIDNAACRPYALRLGVYARGRVGRREHAKLHAHLRQCATCARLYAMVRYVNEQLGALTRPVTVHTGASRGGAVVETFIQTVGSLVDDFDEIEFLHTVAGRCVRLLDVQAAGLMLTDHRGILSAAAASSENARLLELFALQSDAGPCVDVCRSGVAVVNADLRANRRRWPRFAEAAQATGFAAVHALPLRRRENVIGALSLFCSRPGKLSLADERIGQALADMATIGIMAQRRAHQSELIAAQLQRALTNRVIIEQATGMLAERNGITVEVAFTQLREYARCRNLHLSDLARDVTEGAGAAELLRGP
jgi:DNA-directed RNA polymerase specialized sigma24 family protein